MGKGSLKHFKLGLLHNAMQEVIGLLNGWESANFEISETRENGAAFLPWCRISAMFRKGSIFVM